MNSSSIASRPEYLLYGEKSDLVVHCLLQGLLNATAEGNADYIGPANGNFCLLLITFANSLDSDQARPDTLTLFLKYFKR